MNRSKVILLVNATGCVGDLRSYCMLCVPIYTNFFSHKTIIPCVVLKLESLSGSKFFMFLVLSSLFL